MKFFTKITTININDQSINPNPLSIGKIQIKISSEIRI